MTKKSDFQRLHELYPSFGEDAFREWWHTPQALLGGKAPDEVDCDLIDGLITAVEVHARSNTGAE